MKKTCWFCKRNIEDLKTVLPKDFWPQDSKYFVDFKIEGRLKNATASYLASSESYYENMKYEFITIQKSVCLVCIQIMDIENDHAISRVNTYDGISLSQSDRIGIYTTDKFEEIAEEIVSTKQYNDKLRMIKELEEDFGSVFAKFIIGEILDRRNHRKPNVRLDGEYFKTKILTPRLAKRFEEFCPIHLITIDYNLKGEKLVRHLNQIFQSLLKINEDSFEFDEKTEILNVKEVGVFFKVLKKQQRNFNSKLNEFRKILQYSKEDMEKIYKDILKETK